MDYDIFFKNLFKLMQIETKSTSMVLKCLSQNFAHCFLKFIQGDHWDIAQQQHCWLYLWIDHYYFLLKGYKNKKIIIKKKKKKI